MDDRTNETKRVVAIAALLSAAAEAHAEYEQTVLNGVYDQKWPEWYAAYLIEHGLGQLVSGSITAEALSRVLAECDQAYRRENPGVSWPDYYASRLATRFE